jgi:hypothetical protein
VVCYKNRSQQATKIGVQRLMTGRMDCWPNDSAYWRSSCQHDIRQRNGSRTQSAGPIRVTSRQLFIPVGSVPLISAQLLEASKTRWTKWGHACRFCNSSL